LNDFEDPTTDLVQLMNDLEQAGFHADFTLRDGLEITIHMIRKPLIADFIRERKLF